MCCRWIDAHVGRMFLTYCFLEVVFVLVVATSPKMREDALHFGGSVNRLA